MLPFDVAQVRLRSEPLFSYMRAQMRMPTDEIVPTMASSKLSCDVLGWELSHDGRVDVCGSSSVGSNGTIVLSDIVYQDAAETCRKAGARLCRASELVLGAAQSTGLLQTT
jgi:hypothetical protein